MQNEYKGSVTVNMLGAPTVFRYRVVWGVQPHVMEAYTRDGERYLMLSSMPESVQIRVLDAIVADVREREIQQMGVGNA